MTAIADKTATTTNTADGFIFQSNTHTKTGTLTVEVHIDGVKMNRYANICVKGHLGGNLS